MFKHILLYIFSYLCLFIVHSTWHDLPGTSSNEQLVLPGVNLHDQCVTVDRHLGWIRTIH